MHDISRWIKLPFIQQYSILKLSEVFGIGAPHLGGAENQSALSGS